MSSPGDLGERMTGDQWRIEELKGEILEIFL